MPHHKGLDWGDIEHMKPLGVKIHRWTPEQTEQEFLERFEMLTGQRRRCLHPFKAKIVDGDEAVCMDCGKRWSI